MTPKPSISSFARPWAVMTLASLLATATPSRGGAQSACRAASDTAAVLKSYLSDLVTTADSSRASLRAKFGLPAIDSTRIIAVTDPRICRKLVDAMNATFRTLGLARQIYVFRVGETYAVQDPTHPVGEYTPTVVFDGQFHYTGSVLAP